MKREGRQHGMVRTYPISALSWGPRPKPRNTASLGSTPIAGLLAKVPSKPTNHSKFTGKCGRPMCRECHLNPASKSKDKAKGAHRLRSSSNVVVLDNILITQRVVDVMPDLKLSGSSASSILDYLDNDYNYMDEEEYDDTKVEESDYGVPHQTFQVGDMVECEAEENASNAEGWSDSEIILLLFDGDEDWYLV